MDPRKVEVFLKFRIDAWQDDFKISTDTQFGSDKESTEANTYEVHQPDNFYVKDLGVKGLQAHNCS